MATQAVPEQCQPGANNGSLGLALSGCQALVVCTCVAHASTQVLSDQRARIELDWLLRRLALPGSLPDI
jgi:hypothetical protein